MHINKINAWADFWRNQIGVNVIPADAISKKPLVSWKEDRRGNWQIEPIPQSIHDDWKMTKSFEKGMAVICGKVHHNKNKLDLYLCAIDADNKKGIEVLHSKGIDYLASKTLVERHANPNKAHFYFYTHKPMPKKSSDAVNMELVEKMETNEIPSLEMKGDGTHGIMYCTPSPHKDGSRYEILDNKVPVILDDIGDVVNKICDEFSLGRGSGNKVTMQVLMDDETRVVKGSNRHEALMRYAESILRKYPRMEEAIFNDVIMAKNKRMCVPPLDDEQVEIQIKCAVDFISKQVDEEKRLREFERHRFGTEFFWTDVQSFKTAFKPRGKFIECLECKEQISDNPLDKDHYGHKVILKM